MEISVELENKKLELIGLEADYNNYVEKTDLYIKELEEFMDDTQNEISSVKKRNELISKKLFEFEIENKNLSKELSK